MVLLGGFLAQKEPTMELYMALSESDISATKVPHGRNQFKVSDGGGLYLLVKSSGRYWKLAYRFDGKQKSLALGVYPSVSIEQAREKRDAAKALLAQNIDPGEIKKQERMEQRTATQPPDSQGTQERQPIQNRGRRPEILTHREQSIIEGRRLCILQVLADSNAYATSEDVLLQELDSRGHRISFDRLRTDIAWLHEQQVVQLKTGPLWGIYLTQTGLDSALGRMWTPGVKRPEENLTGEMEMDSQSG